VFFIKIKVRMKGSEKLLDAGKYSTGVAPVQASARASCWRIIADSASSVIRDLAVLSPFDFHFTAVALPLPALLAHSLAQLHDHRNRRIAAIQERITTRLSMARWFESRIKSNRKEIRRHICDLQSAKHFGHSQW
jgi:hypothetical protein